MYTRSYQREENSIAIPENYDGNAFRENEYTSQSEIDTAAKGYATPQFEEQAGEVQSNTDEAAPAFKKSKGTGLFGSIFSKIPFKSLLGGRASKLLNLESFKLGSEEILLIATALILLFSSEGDKLCAIMLLFLVFID